MLSYLKHLGNDAPYRDRLGSLLVAYGGVNDISDPTFAELLESEIAHILRYPLADRLMFKTLVESMLNPPPLDSFLALGGPGRFLLMPVIYFLFPPQVRISDICEKECRNIQDEYWISRSIRCSVSNVLNFSFAIWSW